MAIYHVTRACGHEEDIDLHGPNQQRESRLAWMRATPCHDCYSSEGATPQRMSYACYRLNYSDCPTKRGSYDPETKEITVYVPHSKPIFTHEEMRSHVLAISERLYQGCVAETGPWLTGMDTSTQEERFDALREATDCLLAAVDDEYANCGAVTAYDATRRWFGSYQRYHQRPEQERSEHSTMLHTLFLSAVKTMITGIYQLEHGKFV